MSQKECIICEETKPESEGDQLVEDEKTRALGIPTGFICDSCTDDAPEYEGPETPLDLSQYPTAEGAAKALHEWLQEYAESMDYSASAVKLYPPSEAGKKRDGHAQWTVSWEGGPGEWAKNLTAGWPMSHAEFPELDSDPEVVGFRNSNWTAEPYYSFDLQFTDN